MPRLSSVNLSFLTQSDTGAAQALMNLAKYADGPLRLQKSVQNGVTIRSLGVRSWPTYFFETFIAWPCEISRAELKAQKAIDQYVRPFLNNSGLTLAVSAESLTANLQARVVGKSILPETVTEVETGGNDNPGMRAESRPPEPVAGKGKMFNGTGTVPTGLSVAVVTPLQMIADVRLVTSETYFNHQKGDGRRGLTYALSAPPDSRTKASADDYEKYYHHNLMKYASLIGASVVIELQPNADGKCSIRQQNGAWNAAEEFVALQKQNYGKHISIMLTVPTLPLVANESYIKTEKNPPPSSEIPSTDVLVPEQKCDSDSDTEYSNEEI